MTFPNAQNNPAAAIPVWVVSAPPAPSSTSLGFASAALSTAAAVGLPGIPVGATSALVCIEGVNARYRDDGTDPTTSVGMPFFANATQIYSQNLAALKFIAQSGSGTLDVLYYGQ